MKIKLIMGSLLIPGAILMVYTNQFYEGSKYEPLLSVICLGSFSYTYITIVIIKAIRNKTV